MELVQAAGDKYWEIASMFLTQTVERCNRNGLPLWTHSQVRISSLKSVYPSESLYLLKTADKFIGCVFVSFETDNFWSGMDTTNSLFFHKLAIGDEHNGLGFGARALNALLELAKDNGCIWLRCDCHGGRKRLRVFYEQFGFELVDRQEMFGFDVARYQMRTSCLSRFGTRGVVGLLGL